MICIEQSYVSHRRKVYENTTLHTPLRANSMMTPNKLTAMQLHGLISSDLKYKTMTAILPSEGPWDDLRRARALPDFLRNAECLPERRRASNDVCRRTPPVGCSPSERAAGTWTLLMTIC